MLKLLLFVPCERVIVSQSHVTSLIDILETVEAQVREDIAPDAAAPLRWKILTLWHREKEIAGTVKYEQRADMYLPNGEKIVSVVRTFDVNNEIRNYRIISELPAFPVGQRGEVKIKLFLKESGEHNEWSEIAEYPVLVKHHLVNN